jgi:hypothetical protein
MASGLLHATSSLYSRPTRYSHSVSLRLRNISHLTLLHTITRRIILQKARSHPYKYRLLRLVGYWFQVLFHSPPGVLFAFPSRYLFTIGHHRVFSLGWWSTRIPTGFLVSDCTQDTLKSLICFAYEAFTLFGLPSQTVWLQIRFFTLI